MLADLRDALRQLRKAPGFTATVVITLALGIGATTAIFTLVHQVMLKSLPVTKPDELWRVGDKIRCCNWGGYTQGDDGDFSIFSWEAYRNFRQHTPEFVDLAALQAGNAPLGVRRAGSQAPVDTFNGQNVSGNFFRTLGIQPWIGRLMSDADDTEGAPLVAVMSYRVWQTKFASDPSVVGASFQVNGHAFTVIGVTPPGFYGAKLAGYGMPDFWLPATSEQVFADGVVSRVKRPNANYLDILGRVRPGINPQSLEARLRVEFHDWLASHVQDMEPGEKQTWQSQTLHLIPGGAGVASMRDDYKDALKLLLIAAGCVLLVACGNLANMMLARGLRNRAQISVRIALGASRVRLVRGALVESVMLAVVGGIFGIAVAYAGTRLILYLAFETGGPNYVPVNPAPSVPVLLFTMAISILTGVLFGIAPAWMTSHADPVEALRGANRSVGGGRSWAQKSLVIAQAAMSLVLLSAAALLAQSLRNLEHQNFGFELQDRYVASINPTLGTLKPEQMEQLFRQIDDRLEQTPGIKIAAPVLYAPMTGDSWNEGVRIQGRPEPSPKEDVGAGWARVMPGFFEALGAKTLLGRTLRNDDTASTLNVAVVNEAFAKRFFKDQNPIGQHFGIDRLRYASTYEIVGVVKDIRYMTWDYQNPVGPMFWVSEKQTVIYDDPIFSDGEKYSHFLYNIVVWAPGDQQGVEERVRKALASVDASLVLNSVDPYSKIVSGDFHQQNMIATLTSLFGLLGLVLAAVGLYGVMAYTVEQRTNEIGLRMALGADRKHVIAMVLRGALWQVGLGLGLGIPLAVLAGKLMKDQLFGVVPWDPKMLAAATVLLALAAIVASVMPVRRAAGVQPMIALRTD